MLWGDTHLHTTNSLDASTFGVTLDVEDAYRFARGETVISTSGQPAKLSRPLDFLVVTDHSDAMGVVAEVVRGNPELLANPELQALHDNLKKGGEGARQAMDYILRVVIEGTPSPLLDPKVFRSTWERYVEAADWYNEPGRFTAVIGYEWTPNISGDAGAVLRACDRDSNAALGGLRRETLRHSNSERHAHDSSGTGVYIAGLVRAAITNAQTRARQLNDSNQHPLISSPHRLKLAVFGLNVSSGCSWFLVVR